VVYEFWLVLVGDAGRGSGREELYLLFLVDGWLFLGPAVGESAHDFFET
jgi:hypothetical protein